MVFIFRLLLKILYILSVLILNIIKYMKGLTTEQVEKFRNEFGANILTPAPRKSWYAMLFDGFKDPLIIILIVAACVSLFIGEIGRAHV